MVNIEYVKEFNRLSRFSPESRLFILERDFIASMAKLGKLKDLKRGVNPCFRGREVVDEVKVPDEFFSLLTVPNIDVEVQFFGDVPSGNKGKENAFKIRISNYNGVLIEVHFGVISGVQEIWVHSFAPFKCVMPSKYSLVSFAAVLQNDQLEDFVFKYCDDLTEAQKDNINKYGLGD